MSRSFALLRSLALLGAALSLTDRVSADAVMRPPSDCPSGEKGITSHAGPRCVKVEPSDCPAGWRGVLGGDCTLQPCGADQECSPAEACIEHSVCLEPSKDYYYDLGETPPQGEGEESGALPKNYAPELLGAPPSNVERKTPIFRYYAMNLCAPSVACAGPRTCQSEKLCAPKGKRAVAYLGTNIVPVRVARQTEAALTESASGPSEVASPALPRGGCAACAVGSGHGGAGSELRADGAWVLATLGLAAAAAGRRLRQKASSASPLANSARGRPEPA